MELRKTSEDHRKKLNDVAIVSAQCDNGIDNCHENLEEIQNASGSNSHAKPGCQLTSIDKSEDQDSSINGGKDNVVKENANLTDGAQSQTALAFTIDFGNGNKEIDSARYQNLIQKINARHRRNYSTSKIEIKTSKSSTEISSNFLQKQKPHSIHSEGYFSSEDDTKRKVDRLSQKLLELGLKTNMMGATKKSDVLPRSMTDNTVVKRRSYCGDQQNSSNNMRPADMTYSATMNDLSRMQRSELNQEEDRSNRVQYSPEKKYTKNIEYIEINHDYEDEKLEISSPHEMTEKLSNMNYLSDNCPSNAGSSSREKNSEIMSVSLTSELVSSITSNKDIENANLDVFNVSNIDGGSDGTVSEAGTYTIHKDYTDEEKARMDIDNAFSVGILTEEECNESYVHHFKMKSSRDSNTWITEWATQVAEHNQIPSPIGGLFGRTPPMSPSKIPSPIYSRSQRQMKSRYEQSDSSLDIEIQHSPQGGLNSNTLIDSGGESDEDTSNSYPTPPHSSQRTPTHTSLVRRGSLSEALFKRSNNNDCRRSMRKYPDVKNTEEMMFNVPKSPSHVLARFQLEKSNSLDRKENIFDTAELNSSRRSSLRNYHEDNFKHTNSPILNRLRPTTPKLTNSPILGHKTMDTRLINSPSFERQNQIAKLTNSSPSKNIGYYTCMESSPYMLRKSNSTSNYREDTSPGKKELSAIQNSPMFQRNISIQRSSSNNSIRNAKTKNLLARRSSFNDNNGDINRILKGKMAGSDSSSETGETQNQPAPPISSGIKLNRAFSIRRGRLSGDSDTTPTRTPEERRRRGQSEIKSAPVSARQQSYHRGRTNSVGASNKETFKKPEPPRERQRNPSLSRNEGGRYSMRVSKTSSNLNNVRPNQKSNRETSNSGRSNSTLTSKEVEFQNWKRRKNYDPMKAAAEGKKKGLDGPRKNHSIDDSSGNRDNSVLRSASFHGTRGTLSLADDWSDNENNFIQSREIIQPPPPSSPLGGGSDSDIDTSSYLQTTHNVMSAMSARITVYRPTAPVDSGGESDEDTSHSLKQTNKMHHEISDTESSDEARAVHTTTSIKFNRSFGMRRGREQTQINRNTLTKPKVLPVTVRAKSETPSISRTDSGRFSMRMSKGTNAPKNKPKETKKQIKEQILKEQEMQNWKRRKSYDPMKAAMEGKRKAGLAKRNLTPESSSVLRSQSFHGPVSLGISEWSDEDISASADEAPMY